MPTEEKSANGADVVPDSIFQIASGFMAAKHLFVANVGTVPGATRRARNP